MATPSLPFAPAPQSMDWRPLTPWQPTELPSSAPLLPRISSLLKPQQVNRKLSTQEEAAQVAPLQPTGRGTSPRVVMLMPPNDDELLRIRRPSSASSSRDWEHYTPPSRTSPYDGAPTVSSVMRRAMYREFNPRQLPLSTAQESGLDARNRVRPTPTDVSSRYLQPPGPIRAQETAERRRLFYHHDMDPHKIHEIHIPAPHRQVDAEMPRKQARTSRYQVATSHTRPIYYEEEPMDMTGQKRRRVTRSLAAPTHPRQPLYEGEYGLTVLETAKPLVRSRYSPLLERTAESGMLDARRRYARSDLETFKKADRPTSAGSRSSTGSAGVARVRAMEKKAPPAATSAPPRASAKADTSSSLTTLVLKSKEFLKSTSLVRNRHDEIDWVATFLNVGFDSSSIYALMCPLRKGRWKSEEENYTMGLLKLIENGTILLRHGQSIRGYIGQKLHSDDMRVLKKLSNCKMFHFAKLINPRLAEDEKLDMEVAGAKEGLEHLEQLKGDFLRSVQLEALVAVRKYLSDTSLRDLLNVRA